jgi:excinuclease ABC A subunit
VHNLHNVDVEIPRDALVVFTGLSGSGKSSLAFDTIFAEGQRRYVESLSAYARQFLGQVDRPDVDFIEGLSPAVSIDQKSTNRNPRSTVGTITEIYDYMRLLWARIGVPHCPVCGERIQRQTVQQIADQLMELPEGTRYQVLSPVVSKKKGEFVDLFRELAAGGYSRAVVDGELTRPAHRFARDRASPHRRPRADQLRRRERARCLGDVLREVVLSQPAPDPAHRDRAAHLLVQRAVRRVSRVLRARHAHVGR